MPTSLHNTLTESHLNVLRKVYSLLDVEKDPVEAESCLNPSAFPVKWRSGLENLQKALACGDVDTARVHTRTLILGVRHQLVGEEVV